jgi:hypothetical protein
MVEEVDKLLEPYKTLWIDLKNKSMKPFPEIEVEVVNQAWVKTYRQKGLNSGLSENAHVAKCYDLLHYINDQIHYVRGIKDTQL